MRLGNQVPTFETVGEYASSTGAELCAAWREWGTAFYPSQEHEMELFTARDSDNRFASKTIGVSKPRQNGKSFAARKYATTMGAAGKRCLYSAHNGSTVRQMFKYIKDEVESIPALGARLKPRDGIYKAAGNEGIYFASGGCIEFQTRTTSGARGSTYDVIVVDEAQELTYDQLDAIKPTTLASESGDPQMIYIGTPPGPACRGDVFRDMHDLAHSGKSGAWWLEWAVDAVPDMNDTDAVLELAYLTNPALGYRIREDVMLDAIDGYKARPDSFAREYLGWWSPTAGKLKQVIDATAWASCATDAPLEPQKAAYGVKFTPDGAEVVLAVAEVAERLTHVEVIERQGMGRGTAWLADWLAERTAKASCVVIDGRAGSQALVERLDGRCPRGFVRVARMQDVTAAAQMTLDAINGHVLTWFAPQRQLDESARGAIRRQIGSGGGWGFGGDDPAPIEACSLALWGVQTSKRDPSRKQRIG